MSHFLAGGYHFIEIRRGTAGTLLGLTGKVPHLYIGVNS